MIKYLLQPENLLILVGVEYLALGAMFTFQGKIGLGIAHGAYALANVGLYIAAKQTGV